MIGEIHARMQVQCAHGALDTVVDHDDDFRLFYVWLLPTPTPAHWLLLLSGSLASRFLVRRMTGVVALQSHKTTYLLGLASILLNPLIRRG